MNTNKHVDFSHLDDLGKILHHQDFERIVLMATTVQRLYRDAQEPSFFTKVTQSSLQIEEIIDIVARLRKQIGNDERPYDPALKIPRGQCPMTDHLVQDCLIALQREADKGTMVMRGKMEGPVKYSKFQTDILLDWLTKNVHHPFPDNYQIIKLEQETQLTGPQIVNWMTNMRKRSRKATVEGTKKPQSFIDFMFLAEHQQRPDAPHWNMISDSYSMDDMEPLGQHVTVDDALMNEFAESWVAPTPIVNSVMPTAVPLEDAMDIPEVPSNDWEWNEEEMDDVAAWADLEFGTAPE